MHPFDNIIPELSKKLHVPGVSVAVIENSSLAQLLQYGVGNAEKNDPLTETSIFEACSMTKPFFAYAVLKLVERGIIELDTPLVDYLEMPYIEDEPLHEKITTRMVLTHTSGLPNWRPGGRNGDKPLKVLFEPGTEYLYSGEGFWFLQKAVEHITQHPLDKWLEKNLLRPLKMYDSDLVWRDQFEKFAAAGHDENGLVKRDRKLFREPNGAFSLYTTPKDYAKFLIEILKMDRSAPHSLQDETIHKMLSPHIEIPNKLAHIKSTFRCQGWEVMDTNALRYYGHSGNNLTGFRCFHQFNTTHGNGIIIMTNGDNGTELWQKVVVSHVLTA